MLKDALKQKHSGKTPLVLVGVEQHLTCVDHLCQSLQNVQDGDGQDGTSRTERGQFEKAAEF